MLMGSEPKTIFSFPLLAGRHNYDAIFPSILDQTYILSCQIWVYTVWQCPFCRLLGTDGCHFKCLHCMHSVSKYWDTLLTYHTCPKIWNRSFYYLMYPKYCCMYDKQCRPRSDAAFCSIWSGSTLFARAYLSQYELQAVVFCFNVIRMPYVVSQLFNTILRAKL